MDTYPYEPQHEDEQEVRGKDNREIDRGVPSDRIEDVWDVRVAALRPRNARPHEDDYKNREICQRQVQLTEIATRVGTLPTERKREGSVKE